jgi:hypothetical protein
VTTAAATLNAPGRPGPRLPPPDDGPRLPVGQLAHLFPRGRMGRPRHPETIGDYVRRGYRGIYLEGGALTDGGWWSTAAAVDRFLAAVTARALAGDVPAPGPTDDQRRAAAALERIKRMRHPDRPAGRKGRRPGGGPAA